MLHPAPSLAEAPPQADETRHHPPSPESPGRGRQSQSSSPPLRKDTTSSTSTSLTSSTVITITSADTAGTTLSADISPTYSSQAIFSVNDGTDVSPNRRAANNRRRTGPLSAHQREKAALIRKLGACQDCRRRRVACHPSHHNMSWEDAKRKYRSHSPTLPELAPLAGRTLSPTPLTAKPAYSQDPQEMELDNSPTPRPDRLPLSNDIRGLRTPLPSGPRLESKPLPGPITLPGIENFKTDLQGTISRVLSDMSRSRYALVEVLLLCWQDEQDPEVGRAIDELAGVLDKQYHYTLEIHTIPASPDGPKRWLSHKIQEMMDSRDQRDVLKIIYYNGHSYLNGHREMVLASSRNEQTAATIRWSGIQKTLEDAHADVLVIMDAAYYPSSRMIREVGVLEIIAASTSEEHSQHIGRAAFTRALTQELQDRALRRYRSPLSAAELHAKLSADYPAIARERHPEKAVVTSFPAPLHIMMTENVRLPSILLAPRELQRNHVFPAEPPPNAPHVTLTFNLTSEAIDVESWTEWLRVMPEGVVDLKVAGRYRNALP